jgi:hypothetical protein
LSPPFVQAGRFGPSKNFDGLPSRTLSIVTIELNPISTIPIEPTSSKRQEARSALHRSRLEAFAIRQRASADRDTTNKHKQGTNSLFTLGRLWRALFAKSPGHRKTAFRGT